MLFRGCSDPTDFFFPEGKKKRLTDEEALALFWSLTENSNSDNAEFESTENEVWELRPDEYSGNVTKVTQLDRGTYT